MLEQSALHQTEMLWVTTSTVSDRHVVTVSTASDRHVINSQHCVSVQFSHKPPILKLGMCITAKWHPTKKWHQNPFLSPFSVFPSVYACTINTSVVSSVLTNLLSYSLACTSHRNDILHRSDIKTSFTPFCLSFPFCLRLCNKHQSDSLSYSTFFSSLAPTAPVWHWRKTLGSVG